MVLRLVLCGLLYCAFDSSAEVIERKPYDFEGSLDITERAKQEGWKLWAFAGESEFHALQLKFTLNAFDDWIKRLSLIRSGMTDGEIKHILSPKKSGIMVGTGVGIIAYYQLDDAYFVHALFSDDGRLKDIARRPIALTYGVSRDPALPTKTK
jgi:hypothetical protein